MGFLHQCLEEVRKSVITMPTLWRDARFNVTEWLVERILHDESPAGQPWGTPSAEGKRSQVGHPNDI